MAKNKAPSSKKVKLNRKHNTSFKKVNKIVKREKNEKKSRKKIAKKKPILVTPLARFSKLRSQIWRKDGERIGNYSDTVQIASYVWEKRKTKRKNTRFNADFIHNATLDYLRSKKKPKRKKPVKKLKKIRPRAKKREYVFPPKLKKLSNFFNYPFEYFELNDRMDELESSDIEKDVVIRSPHLLSNGSTEFKIGEYKYTETFQVYVTQIDKLRAESGGGSVFIQCQMEPPQWDEKAKVFFIRVYELGDTGEERETPVSETTPPEGPLLVLKTEENINNQINNRENLLNKIQALEKLVDQANIRKKDTIVDISSYRSLEMEDQVALAKQDLNKIIIDIKELNKEISKLKNQLLKS